METSLGFPVDFFPSTNPLNSLRWAPVSICDRCFVCQETARLLVSTATRTFDLRDVLMGKTLRNFRISHGIPIMSHQILSMMTYGWLVVPGTMEFWMTFHIHWEWNVIIPTDFHSIIFQRSRFKPPTRHGFTLGFYGISWEYHWVKWWVEVGIFDVQIFSEDLSNETGDFVVELMMFFCIRTWALSNLDLQ